MPSTGLASKPVPPIFRQETVIKNPVASGHGNEIQTAKNLAGRLNIPYVDPMRAFVEPAAVALLEAGTAFRRQVLPMRVIGDRLLVAMCDPDQPVQRKSLELLTGFKIKPAISTRSSLETALRKYYENEEQPVDIKNRTIVDVSEATPVNCEKNAVKISIISNKGGVGKTHLSINLAYALAKTGSRVLLIDADLGNADISNKLGMFPKYHLMDFLDKKKEMTELIYPTDFGFDIICGSYGEFKLANLYHAQKLKFIKHFQKISNMYDFAVFDLGAGISRTVLDFALAADHTLIVTTPQDVISGYACTKAAFSRFREIEKRLEEKSTDYEPQPTFCPKVVINQVNDLRQGFQLFNTIQKTADTNINGVEERFRIKPEYMGSIPYDKDHLRAAEGKRMPLLLTSPKIKAAQSIRHMSGIFSESDEGYDPKIKYKNPLKRFVSILSQKT